MENNSKTDKPKPLRRKAVTDSFVAPRLDSKSTQYPATKGMQHFRRSHEKDDIEQSFCNK